MINFAEIDENNIVKQIIVVDINDCLDLNGVESDEVGATYCSNLMGGRWVRASGNNRANKREPSIGMEYLPEHGVFTDPKKKPWHILNNNYEWHNPPLLHPETGEPFTHDELAYICYHVRHTKGYRLCPAVLKDPSDALTSAACLTTSYMYPTFETITYGTNTVAQLVPHQVAGDRVIVNTNFTMSKYLDVTPIGLILKTTFEVYNDVTNPIMNMHPQTAARTPHELFRLIIEWAWAHTDLGNKEAVSKVCHDLLRAVQMPIEVRNELLTEVDPQAVERYIRGLDPFYATDISIISDPPMPPLFEAWVQSARDTFRYREAPPEGVSFNYEVVDYESLPAEYPR